MDDIFQRLQAVLREGQSGPEAPVWLLDGSTILLDHEPDLLKQYPPASNQHGGSHWATLRLVVAHDVDSGLAVRPACFRWPGRLNSISTEYC